MKTLQRALLFSPRVFADGSLVIVERFVPATIDLRMGLLENCFYNLTFAEENMFYRDYRTLVQVVTESVGYELAYSECWSITPMEEL